MKQLLKMAFALVLMISVFGVSLKADAATTPGNTVPVEKKPYEYEFVVDPAKEYNGFSGAKDLVVTFDKNINSITRNDVYVEQLVTDQIEKLPIIDEVIASGNTLRVSFKNLEFINYSKEENFRLVIKEGSLYFDHLTDYDLPFKIYDLLPGFESTFVTNGNAELINNNIFKHNEPRQVLIQIPPVYMTKIETIHRYKGVTDPTKNAPNLSNIDVEADAVATRLKVRLGNNSQYERDLDRSISGVNGFSMGQAGIEELTCKDEDKENGVPAQCEASDDFQLTAYSKDGRKLATKNFKMRVNDREKDYKINDYVKVNAKLFGKSVSLYELMSSPVLLDQIMQGTEVSALDNLGVTYSVGNTIKVENLEQLQLALANEQFKIIELSNDINVNSLPNDTLVIDRNVTLKGGTITGNLKLGEGTANRTIRLDGTTINGDLTIDVGAEGTAIVSTSTVTGTTNVVSGDVKSIHLHDFSSANGINMENTTPVRIVMSYSDNSINKNFGLTMASSQKVTLEGLSGEATVSVKEGIPANLEVKNGASGAKIIEGTTGSGASMNLSHSDEVDVTAITSPEWTVKKLETVYEEGKEVILKNYNGELSDTSQKWASQGRVLNDLTNLQLPDTLNLDVEDATIFGSESIVSFESQTRLLKITGASENQSATVILKGEANGKVYKVAVLVTISND
ncbi:hypothetical protein [Sporosarcina obsidiansis]|uniref:hypothetical protein n=1 Tax=Sporosarcina obsidiansis TaxID=2660748 RepID=UPI00129A1B8A|nr:hypothetical protein [Sporosarcina obsidiansis]